MKEIFLLFSFYVIPNKIFSQIDGSILKNNNAKASVSIFSLDQKSIASLVAEISSNETVDAQYTNFSGTESLQYRRFLELSRRASESQLIALTEHYSSNVKAYAFGALIIRKSVSVESIYQKNSLNAQTFLYHAGCIVESKTMGNWFAYLISTLPPVSAKSCYQKTFMKQNVFNSSAQIRRSYVLSFLCGQSKNSYTLMAQLVPFYAQENHAA